MREGRGRSRTVGAGRVEVVVGCAGVARGAAIAGVAHTDATREDAVVAAGFCDTDRGTIGIGGHTQKNAPTSLPTDEANH